ncbi:MAG TPA: nuclear transport factor 2 family protein [Candidatus Paceibacterota bacterium]|nr:nuclear transport factor 2 family protein [Candidatus Paceibacterota bacterium]
MGVVVQVHSRAPVEYFPNLTAVLRPSDLLFLYFPRQKFLFNLGKVCLAGQFSLAQLIAILRSFIKIYYMSNRTELAKKFYKAFSEADRDSVEKLLAPDFTLSAPPDSFLDRNGFFERAWSGAAGQVKHEFVRLIEQGDEVVVTYEETMPDGTKRCNTEVLTFAEDKIRRSEVYFGYIKQ